MAADSPFCDFGWEAVDFSLPGVDGAIHTLADVRGPNGTLIMFICNHCPYVKAITNKITHDASEVQALGIGVVAICANDATLYPADNFANMKIFASQSGFTFPYLHDESQAVARAYDAICTPDFFGFNRVDELQYRGRLDESKTTPLPNAKRELLEAILQIAETDQGPRQQIPSMGCSIKWKSTA